MIRNIALIAASVLTLTSGGAIAAAGRPIVTTMLGLPPETARHARDRAKENAS